MKSSIYVVTYSMASTVTEHMGSCAYHSIWRKAEYISSLQRERNTDGSSGFSKVMQVLGGKSRI